MPAGCSASVAELFFVSPGAGWKCGACTFAPARRLQPATRRQLSWLSPSDLCPKGCQLDHLGESFWKLEREGQGGAAPPLQTPGRAPKLMWQVQRSPHPPLCFLPPFIPGLQLLKGLSSCATDFPQFQLRTCRVHRSHLAWGVGWGVACLAVQPCRCGSLASWRAGCGTKPSRGAHVTAVCLGGGNCRGQCKGGMPEQAGARREPQVSTGGSLGVARPRVAFGLQGTVQSHRVTATFT